MSTNLMGGINVEKVADQSASIREATVVLSLRCGVPGTKRAVKDTTNVIDKEIGADDDAVHVAKEIFESASLKKIRALITKARARVIGVSVPVRFLRSGLYLMPISVAADINDFLKETADAVAREAIEFTTREYPTLITEAPKHLGKLFDPLDFPDPAKLRDGCYISWSWVDFETPTRLRKVSEALFEKERARSASLFDALQREAVSAMRTQLKLLVDEFVEKLKPQSDAESDRKKIVRKDAANRIEEWLNVFPLRNVANDAELSAQVTRLRGVLAGVSGEELRDSDRLREYVRNGFEEAKAEIDNLVALAPPRRVILD